MLRVTSVQGKPADYEAPNSAEGGGGERRLLGGSDTHAEV